MEQIQIGIISLWQIYDRKNKPALWYADIHTGGTETWFKLDTGSKANIIPIGLVKKMKAYLSTTSFCP